MEQTNITLQGSTFQIEAKDWALKYASYIRLYFSFPYLILKKFSVQLFYFNFIQMSERKIYLVLLEIDSQFTPFVL